MQLALIFEWCPKSKWAPLDCESCVGRTNNSVSFGHCSFVVCPRCHFCSLAAGQPCLAPLNHGAPSACSCACSAGGGLQLCQANDCLGQCDWLRREISQLAELCLLLAVAYPPPPLPPPRPVQLRLRGHAEHAPRPEPCAGARERGVLGAPRTQGGVCRQSQLPSIRERCAGRVQWEGGGSCAQDSDVPFDGTSATGPGAAVEFKKRPFGILRYQPGEIRPDGAEGNLNFASGHGRQRHEGCHGHGDHPQEPLPGRPPGPGLCLRRAVWEEALGSLMFVLHASARTIIDLLLAYT